MAKKTSSNKKIDFTQGKKNPVLEIKEQPIDNVEKVKEKTKADIEEIKEKSTTSQETQIVSPLDEKTKKHRIATSFFYFLVCLGSCLIVATYLYLKMTDYSPLTGKRPQPKEILPQTKAIEKKTTLPEFLAQEEQKALSQTTSSPEEMTNLSQVNPSQEETLPTTEQEDLIKDAQASLIEIQERRINALEMENKLLQKRTIIQKDITPLLIGLSRKVYEGEPFKKEIEIILYQDPTNQFAKETQEQLGSYLTEGIPTIKQVKSLFENKFNLALKAYYKAEKHASLWQKVGAFTSSLVRVYPQELSPENASGISWLYLARQQVQQEQFDLALKSISHLPVKSQQALADFTQLAQKHIEAYRILNTIFNERNDE